MSTEGAYKRYLPPKFVKSIPNAQPRISYLRRVPVCTGKLISIVESARHNDRQRNKYRELYDLARTQNPDLDIQLLFIIGTDENEPSELYDLPDKIFVSHRDIITGDFIDTYDNLPLKTFAAYQYFLDFCPHATNLIMHDDDMVPRLDAIQNLVDKQIACLNGNPIRDMENSKLTRYGGKYHFFVDQIPTDHIVPAYCNGQCSMLNYDTVHKIYEVAKQTDRNGFRLEDVYFTGLLRQKAEIPLGVEHELEMAYCDEAETDDLLERVLDSGNFSLMRSEPRQ